MYLTKKIFKFSKEIFLLSLCFVISFSQAGSTQNNNKSYVGDYLKANYLLNNQDLKNSGHFFQRALQNNSKNPTLLWENIYVQVMNGNVNKATELSFNYLKHDPKSNFARLILSIDATKKNNYQKAYNILAQAGTLNEKESIIDAIILPYMMMWLDFAQGNKNQAIETSIAFSKNTDQPLRFLTYQTALMYDLSGNKHQAKIYFDRIMDFPHTSYNMVANAGNFYLRTANYQKAKEVFIKFNKQNPYVRNFSREIKMIDRMGKSPTKMPGRNIKNAKDGIIEVLYEATRAVNEVEFYSESLKYINLILFIDPSSDEGKLLLANYYKINKKVKDANDIYYSLKRNSDFYLPAQINLAENLYRSNNKQEAKLLLLKLNSYDNNNNALFSLANLLAEDNKCLEAEKFYSRIIDKLKNKVSEDSGIFFQRAICYDKLNQWSLAEKDLLKAISLNAANPDILNYLAYNWIDNNIHLDQAKIFIDAAIAMKPDDPQILDSMGWLLYQQQKFDEAIDVLESAISLMPSDATINEHLGDAYWKTERKREARFQWQRAIKFSKNDPLLINNLTNKLNYGIDPDLTGYVENNHK